MQPIVDDVLRLWHSDQPDRQGIHVSAERFATTLVLRISIESSRSNASNELEMARGVVHARQRLAELFGADQELIVEQTELGRTVLRITLPFRYSSQRGGELATKV
jgi:LytS/YehU family sensor histidine kinase